MGKNSIVLILLIICLFFRASVSSSSSSTNQPLKLNSENNSTNKIVIDPAFIRQALFHPSNNTPNPVQFQVKL
jgi:hypothetical protein